MSQLPHTPASITNITSMVVMSGDSILIVFPVYKTGTITRHSNFSKIITISATGVAAQTKLDDKFFKIKKIYLPINEVFGSRSIGSSSIIASFAAMAAQNQRMFLASLSMRHKQPFCWKRGQKLSNTSRQCLSNIFSHRRTNYYPTPAAPGLSQTITCWNFTRTVSIAPVNRDNTTKDISIAGTDDPKTN